MPYYRVTMAVEVKVPRTPTNPNWEKDPDWDWINDPDFEFVDKKEGTFNINFDGDKSELLNDLIGSAYKKHVELNARKNKNE